MGIKNQVVVLSILLVTFQAARVSFIGKQIPTFEELKPQHFLNILKQNLGQLTEREIQNSKAYLSAFASGNLLEPVAKMAIFLISHNNEPSELNYMSISSIQKNDFILKTLSENLDIITTQPIVTQNHQFSLINLLGKSQQQITQIVQKANQDIQKIVISATDKEIHKLTNTLQKHQQRLLQTAPPPGDGFLVMFIFSIFFIIVTVAIVMQISYMQNQKDTLLYAKFIADVGGR